MKRDEQSILPTSKENEERFSINFESEIIIAYPTIDYESFEVSFVSPKILEGSSINSENIAMIAEERSAALEQLEKQDINLQELHKQSELNCKILEESCQEYQGLYKTLSPMILRVKKKNDDIENSVKELTEKIRKLEEMDQGTREFAANSILTKYAHDYEATLESYKLYEQKVNIWIKNNELFKENQINTKKSYEEFKKKYEGFKQFYNQNKELNEHDSKKLETLSDNYKELCEKYEYQNVDYLKFIEHKSVVLQQLAIYSKHSMAFVTSHSEVKEWLDSVLELHKKLNSALKLENKDSNIIELKTKESEIEKEIKTPAEKLIKNKHKISRLIKSLKLVDKRITKSEVQKKHETAEENFENDYVIIKTLITDGEKKEISFTLKEMREQSINLKTLNDKLTSSYQDLNEDYKKLEQEQIKLLNTKNEIIKSDDFKEELSIKKPKIFKQLNQNYKIIEEQYSFFIEKYKKYKEHTKAMQEGYKIHKRFYEEFTEEYEEFERSCKQHQESKEYSTKNFENTLPLEWSYETLCEDYHMYDQSCSQIEIRFNNALKNLNKIYEHIEKYSALNKQFSEPLDLDSELNNKDFKETESQKKILELEAALKAKEEKIKNLEAGAEKSKSYIHKQLEAERQKIQREANERILRENSEKDEEIKKLKQDKVSSNNRVKELKDANETLNNAINRHREREDKKAQKTNEVSSNIERKEIERLKKDIADFNKSLKKEKEVSTTLRKENNVYKPAIKKLADKYLDLSKASGELWVRSNPNYRSLDSCDMTDAKKAELLTKSLKKVDKILTKANDVYAAQCKDIDNFVNKQKHDSNSEVSKTSVIEEKSISDIHDEHIDSNDLGTLG